MRDTGGGGRGIGRNPWVWMPAVELVPVRAARRSQKATTRVRFGRRRAMVRADRLVVDAGAAARPRPYVTRCRRNNHPATTNPPASHASGASVACASKRHRASAAPRATALA